MANCAQNLFRSIGRNFDVDVVMMRELAAYEKSFQIVNQADAKGALNTVRQQNQQRARHLHETGTIPEVLLNSLPQVNELPPDYWQGLKSMGFQLAIDPIPHASSSMSTDQPTTSGFSPIARSALKRKLTSSTSDFAQRSHFMASSAPTQ